MARPRKQNPEAPVSEDTAVAVADETQNHTEAAVEKAEEKPVVQKPKAAPKKVKKSPFSIEPGDVVSLDMKKRKFLMFPLPGGKIFRLSPGDEHETCWSSEIPEDTPDRFLRALEIALESGDIVRGEKFLPQYPKNDKVIEHYCKKLTEPLDRLVKELKPLVLHKGLIGGYMCADIIRHMQLFEQKNYHRKQYIDLLQEALDHIGGPGPITVTPVRDITLEAAGGLAEDLDTLG